MLRGYIDAYLADIAAAPTRRLTIIVILSKIQYTDIDTLSSNPTSRSRSKPLDVYACSGWSMVDGRSMAMATAGMQAAGRLTRGMMTINFGAKSSHRIHYTWQLCRYLAGNSRQLPSPYALFFCRESSMTAFHNSLERGHLSLSHQSCPLLSAFLSSSSLRRHGIYHLRYHLHDDILLPRTNSILAFLRYSKVDGGTTET